MDAMDEEEWEELGISVSSDEDVEQSVSHSKSLNLTLAPELLRGTPLSEALKGFGQHWESLHSGQGNFHLSSAVKSMDVFLSHDWETSRWLKLFTLLLRFNCHAAVLASLLFSVVLGLVADMSKANLWMFSSYLVFLSFLCFWQRMRNCMFSPLMVFLDKLCIHQEDQEMKEKGILGLGAFVRRSDKLLVLWSKRTFSRLWCVFEIACFLSGPRPLDQLEILPVTAGGILFANAFLQHLIMIAYALAVNLIILESGTATAPIFVYVGAVGAVLVPLASALVPFTNYVGMSMMDDLDQLPQQLQNLQVQSCECYCCSHKHQHPVTGETMICDRELVYQSLRDLFADDCLDPLEKFNCNVRETLGPRMLRRLRLDLPLRYVSVLVLVSNLPLLSQLIWVIKQGSTSLQGSDYAVWCVRLIVGWAQPCQALIFGFAFSMRLWNMRKISFFRKRKVFLSILLSPIQSLAVGCVWGSLMITLASEDNSLIPLIPFLATLVLNLLLHWL